MATIEHYSHYGIFTFIDKYSHNWAGVDRDEAQVQHYMVRTLFPRTPEEEIWQEFQQFTWREQPEAVWQFCGQRYSWAKDQWPNISGPMTTMWTLEDLGLLDQVDPALVQRLNEARRLPPRLERMYPFDDDHLDHNVEDDEP